MDKQAARKARKERSRKGKKHSMAKPGYSSSVSHQRKLAMDAQKKAERESAMEAFLGQQGFLN